MSKIEWTEKTWNIITGCTKRSEGCRNCYAEKMHKRLCAMCQNKYADGFNKVVFHMEELNRNFGKKPKMIFVNSMSDTFHANVEDNSIIYILDMINQNKQHTFQLLTKRSERLQYFGYPSNVWLGVTVEHPDYKFRIDDLRETHTKVKFLSCEPLLGDLGELDLSGIDWVICGGESGHNARPCHPDWVRNIQRQCVEQNVPFFFKQWGEWQNGSTGSYFPEKEFIVFNNGDIIKNTKRETVTYFYRTCKGISSNYEKLKPTVMSKVGKKKAGSLLDGKEYKEYPKAVPV